MNALAVIDTSTAKRTKAPPALPDVHAIASDATKLKRYVTDTVTAYAGVSRRLHHAACMSVWRAAQFRECSALQALYASLRVNDQTALRRWIASLMVDGPVWIKFAKDTFVIVKGSASEGLYDLDALIAGPSFLDLDVSRPPKPITLDALLEMLQRACADADKKSTDNAIALPATVSKAMLGLVHAATVAQAQASLVNEAA